MVEPLSETGDYDLVPEIEPNVGADGHVRRTTHVFCKLCMAWRAGKICHSCGVDLDTGELTTAPEIVFAGESEAPQPAQRTLHAEGTPGSLREVVARVYHTGLRGWVAPLLYLPAVAMALSFQEIPWTGDAFATPGQVLTSCVLSFALLERTRAARLDLYALDLIELGALLARSLLLMPLLVGLGTLPATALPITLPLALLAPLVLGAFSADGWAELFPSELWRAFRATPRYLSTALLAGSSLVLALAACWAVPDGSAALRALLAVGGVTFAAALSGGARRDAELARVIEVDDEAPPHEAPAHAHDTAHDEARAPRREPGAASGQ